MERVVVLGCGGAGKTTLAIQLGAALGLPVIHLDRHYWKPGWVQTPDDEWGQLVAKLTQGKRWVIDGNYGNTLDVRLAAADTAVLMDFPTALCLWRIVARWIRYWGRSRPDMGPGCPEALDWEFVSWVATFRRKSRPRVLERLERNGHLQVIVLRGPGDVRRFLQRLTRVPLSR